MKKILLVSLLLVSTVASADELPKPTLQLEKQLTDKDYSGEVKPSVDLPNPNLILERGLVYTPTTRIRRQIINGDTNIAQFKALPESEYWRGN